MQFNRKQQWILAAILAVAAACFAYVIYRVWLESARPTQALVVSGNIEARESVLSFNQVQSRIVDLPFDEGKTITAGGLLTRVDDAVYRQQLKIAEAAVAVQQRQRAAAAESLLAARKTVLSDEADLAQKSLNLDRARKLWQQRYVSTDARDLAQTAAKQSGAVLARDRALVGVAQRNLELPQAAVHDTQENLRMAHVMESYTTLTAPFPGVILVRQAELGEVTAPGTPVFTLADLDHVWLRAYFNEPFLGKVRLGEAVTVSTDTWPNGSFPGRIAFIASSAEFTPKSVETHAERITLVYRIRIDIGNPGHALLPGMPADAQIALLPAE